MIGITSIIIMIIIMMISCIISKSIFQITLIMSIMENAMVVSIIRLMVW